MRGSRKSGSRTQPQVISDSFYERGALPCLNNTRRVGTSVNFYQFLSSSIGRELQNIQMEEFSLTSTFLMQKSEKLALRSKLCLAIVIIGP